MWGTGHRSCCRTKLLQGEGLGNREINMYGDTYPNQFPKLPYAALSLESEFPGQ